MFINGSQTYFNIKKAQIFRKLAADYFTVGAPAAQSSHISNGVAQ